MYSHYCITHYPVYQTAVFQSGLCEAHLQQEVKKSLQQWVAVSLRLLPLVDLCCLLAGQGGHKLGNEVNGALHSWFSVVHHHRELDELPKLGPEGILAHLKAESVTSIGKN